MDKKKVLAGALVLVAAGVLSYALLPGYFGGGEKPASPKTDAAKSKPQTPALPAASGVPHKSADSSDDKKMDRVDVARGGVPNAARVPSGIIDAGGPAAALLPSAPPALAADEQRIQSLLRERDKKLLDHEYKRTLRRIEREEIEDDTSMEKARLEAEKAKLARTYLRANPSQMKGNEAAAGGTGPTPSVVPMTGQPGAGGVPAGTDSDPVLRMISMVGNEKVALIEYHGSLYRTKVGDSIGAWRVKAVADDNVQISHGKTVKTLPFALPTGAPAGFGSPLPPPPGVSPRPGSA